MKFDLVPFILSLTGLVIAAKTFSEAIKAWKDVQMDKVKLERQKVEAAANKEIVERIDRVEKNQLEITGMIKALLNFKH